MGESSERSRSIVGSMRGCAEYITDALGGACPVRRDRFACRSRSSELLWQRSSQWRTSL